MTIKEIREKETDHLGHELLERRKHLFDLKSQAVTEKLEDPSQLGKTRKDIARMMTVLRQRQLETSKGNAPAADASAPAKSDEKKKSAKPKAQKGTPKKTVKKATTKSKTTKRTTKAKAE